MLLLFYLVWCSGVRNWLLFYFVFCWIVFILMWPMLFFLRKEKAHIFIGAAAIFLIANLVAFQPNLYDNNKLLYIWFMLTDILVCDWIWRLLDRLDHKAIRNGIAGILVFLGTFSGFLSILREAVSEYQLLSAEQVEVAEFILEETEPDSLFLTDTNHNNAIPVLTGRNIVCGSSLYLYYHGVDYSERAYDIALMYQGGEAFEQFAEELGIDYV